MSPITPRPSRNPDNSTARIVAVLGAFDERNTPIGIGPLLLRANIARSTGYRLVRALVSSGYLEPAGTAAVRLGPAARALAFWSPNARPAHEDVRAQIWLPKASTPATPDGHENTLSLEPELLELVDTAAFRRPPPYFIGFSNASLSNPWRTALVQGMQHQARVRSDRVARLSVRTADDDPAQQVHDVDALVAEGIDLLIVSTVRPGDAPLERRIAELRSAGMPVVAVDRNLADTKAVVSFVTASDRVIGATSARWLAERIGGKGRLWMLSGAASIGPAADRRAAAMAVFRQYPDLRVDASVHTEWRSDRAFQAVSELLQQADGAPQGVWCDSGLQGIGSIKAFLAAGYGRGNIPPHTGGDLNRMYRLALEQRVPLIGIDYPAAMGARALSLALSCLAGEPVPRRLHTDLQCVISRGFETDSVKADVWAEQHVRWDMPGEFILSHGHAHRQDARTHT